MTIIKGKTCHWEMVVGLEVHAQITSNSKLFSRSSTGLSEYPNTHVSLFDAAMPGTLPVLNSYCVEQVIRTGLALSAQINKTSYFDRKNYFYPDLPQGYQITQFYHPIVTNGIITLEECNKEIRIARIHLEQDAGKSIHDNNKTYIDLNRAGVGLMEIVSEADFRSTEEVAEYIKKLRMILRYIGSCDGDMEKGSLRCDVNVSVRPLGDKTFGTRSEIKNLNSIRYIVQAIEYEANRQVNELENGELIQQATLLFDVNSGTTKIMRTKEDAQDYRYFPEPDVPSIEITDNFIDNIKSTLPELPDQKRKRYIDVLKLTKYDADLLASDKDVASYFEEVIKKHDIKLAISWITGELFARLNKLGLNINSSPIKSHELIELLDLIADNTISAKIAKQVFDKMFQTGKQAKDIVAEQGLQQIVDSNELAIIIDNILANNANKIEEYKQGKTKIFDYLIGQIMKETRGKANPELLNSLLKKKLI